jgi:ribosome biogenesis GTPase A
MLAGKPVEEGVLTIGTLGHPNVGKSSLINSLIGKKVVSVSRYCSGVKIPQLMRLGISRNVSCSNSSLPVFRIRDPMLF